MKSAIVYQPVFDWKARFFVDGREVYEIVTRRGLALPLEVSKLVSKENGRLEQRLLTFATLVRSHEIIYTDKQRTTDNDDDVTLSAAGISMVGQISVELARGTRGETTGGLAATIVAQADVGIASECSKK